MADPKQTFDMGAFLKTQGMSVAGVDDTGQVTVNTPDGKQAPLDVDAVMKHLGAPPKNQFNIEYNSPEQATDISPVSLWDRTRQAPGNNEGIVADLKTKFQDAKVDPKLGIVVNNKGVWQQVDPSFFGEADAWEASKAMLKAGFKSLGPVFAYNMAKGTLNHGIGSFDALKEALPIDELKTVAGQLPKMVAGAAHSLAQPGALKEMAADSIEAIPALGQAGMETLGGMGGGVPGAMGMGALASTGKHVLGKLFGTYKATPAQETFDVLMDGSMAGLGQVLVPGQRATIKDFDNVLKTWAKDGAEGTKNMLSSIWGASGASPDAFKTVLNDAPAYIAKRTELRAQAGTMLSDGVIKEASKAKAAITEDTVTSAAGSLTKQFGEKLMTLADNAEGKGLVIKPEEHVIAPINNVLQKAGIGQYVVQKSEADGTEKLIFQAPSFKDSVQGIKSGSTQIPEAAQDELTPQLNRIGKMLDKVRNIGDLKGEEAAYTTRYLEKNLNFLLQKDSPAANYGSLLQGKMKEALIDGIGPAFKKVGLEAEHAELNSFYKTNSPLVETAKGILNTTNGADSLAKAYFAKDKNETKAVMNGLFDLLGETGADMKKDLLLTHAVQDTAPLFKGKFLQGAAIGSMVAGGMALGGPASLAITVPIAAQFSPAIAAREANIGVSAARALLPVLRGLDKATLQQVLGNPAIFETLLRPVIDAGPMKDHLHQAIMQKVQQAVARPSQGAPQQGQGGGQ